MGKVGTLPFLALRHRPGHPEPETFGGGAAFASLCEAIPDETGRKKELKTGEERKQEPRKTRHEKRRDFEQKKERKRGITLKAIPLFYLLEAGA